MKAKQQLDVNTEELTFRVTNRQMSALEAAFELGVLAGRGNRGIARGLTEDTIKGAFNKFRTDINLVVKIGDVVDIASRGHWADAQWGIVEFTRGDEIHVSVFGGDECLAFEADELTTVRELGR